MKSVLWRVAKRLSHTEDARCLKFKKMMYMNIKGDAQKCQEVIRMNSRSTSALTATTHSYINSHIVELHSNTNIGFTLRQK